MRLIVDMNLSPRWVDTLKDAGFETVHWSTVGRPDAPDATIMTKAVAAGAIVLTHDLDFGAILAASGAVAPSIVQIRADDLSPAPSADGSSRRFVRWPSSWSAALWSRWNLSGRGCACSR